MHFGAQIGSVHTSVDRGRTANFHLERGGDCFVVTVGRCERAQLAGSHGLRARDGAGQTGHFSCAWQFSDQSPDLAGDD